MEKGLQIIEEGPKTNKTFVHIDQHSKNTSGKIQALVAYIDLAIKII